MPNKLITALKENKGDVRKKVIIVTAVSAAVIGTAIVLSKMKDNTTDVLLLTPAGDNVIADAVLTE